jgi:hypothetical protein
MTNVKAQVYVDTTKLVADGYAEFNNMPHLAVDVPDGDGMTITARTSEGKRITFSFLPYRKGGAPQCVDICYHDNGTARIKEGVGNPTFDVILMGETEARAVPTQYDTRKQPFKPGIVCVLMETKEEEKA